VPEVLAEGKSMEIEKYLPKIAEDLGMDLRRLIQLYGVGNLQLITDHVTPYLRFKREEHGVEEGTVIFLGDELVYARGFPKIRRAMLLGSALSNHLKDGFQAEEKLDGYNIRTIMLDDLICLTRKGIVCPYTTQHIRELLKGNKFFEDNPGLMLCGEVVGLENPYQTKSYPEARDFGYFIFDIRDRRTGKALSISEKNGLLEKYSLPSARSFGVFTAKDGKRLLKLVRKLGKERREGIVLKSLDMKQQMKYTSNSSTNNDLRYAFKFVFDYGQSFMFRRLVREAFQAYELGLTKKELEREADRLGRSILLPMVEAIRKIASGKETTEDFRLSVPDAASGKAFIEHLKHLGVHATIEKISRNQGDVIIKVKRHYPATNDKIKAYLKGEFCSD
jgi:putative ATP-dependent DNA ligase